MRRLPFLAACAAAIAIVGCGGGDDGSSSSSGTPAQSESDNPTEQLFAGSATANLKDPAQGKKGGTLSVLSAGDVDFLDPGKTYYTYTIGIINALHRGLYAYLPQDASKPVPDLAADMPQISKDGRTVTVKLRKGVMFSDPVDREVTSADVKYAIERAFTAAVSNGYVQTYFGDLIGAPKAPGDYRPINGIQTPDKHTIVFKLNAGTGAALAGALAMPISVPVPKEFARRYDREVPST
ncbi:MAG: ABC transporter substrate-binding protein, partial [Vicinamibacteria bacterium]